MDMMPYRLNTANLDRYAYTSNCPTKYTDPSGHCDVSKAIAGGSLILLGSYVGGLGLGLAVVGIGELSVGAPTVVGIFIGFHSVAVGGMMAGVGYFIIRSGVQSIINSDCIPGIENDS